MFAKKISLCRFRNVERAEVEFSPGVNVLVGENAQGKTNLLEAVYLTSLGKSFRTSVPSEMIAFGAESAQVTLLYEDSARESEITVTLGKGRQKKIEKNGMKVEKLSQLVGGFRCVIFCPEHLLLVKEGPGERRNFLDIAISRNDPAYMASLQRYNRCLLERNALLRNAYKDRETLEKTSPYYSQIMAKEAAFISKRRLCYVKKAEEAVKECFAVMTGETEVPSLVYVPVLKQPEEAFEDENATAEKYFHLYTTALEREIGAGCTLYGIHKDDMEIRLNDKSARLYASQGQQRSLALALKMAEAALCRECYGDDPVLLLDDVLSELDKNRRNYLLRQIKGKQVIITTCDQRAGIRRILGRTPGTRIINVANGVYEEDTV